MAQKLESLSQSSSILVEVSLNKKGQGLITAIFVDGKMI